MSRTFQVLLLETLWHCWQQPVMRHIDKAQTFSSMTHYLTIPNNPLGLISSCFVPGVWVHMSVWFYRIFKVNGTFQHFGKNELDLNDWIETQLYGSATCMRSSQQLVGATCDLFLHLIWAFHRPLQNMRTLWTWPQLDGPTNNSLGSHREAEAASSANSAWKFGLVELGSWSKPDFANGLCLLDCLYSFLETLRGCPWQVNRSQHSHKCMTYNRLM